MPETINDAEFGIIPIRRVARARWARLRIGHGGEIRISLPKRAPRKLAAQLLDSSRNYIRKVLSEQPPAKKWADGDLIGAVHRLQLIPDETIAACKTAIKDNRATLRHHPRINETELQTELQNFIKKILRKQAEAYLPRRLKTLVETHGFLFPATIRFSSAKTRWGSCSSSGTMSLNISLMNLPHEIIDYVLIHELCHTRHMNHSKDFWELVEHCQPDFKLHRRSLKRYNPGV